MFGIKYFCLVTALEETPSSAQHGVRSDKTLLLSKEESAAAAVVEAVAALLSHPRVSTDIKYQTSLFSQI